MLTVCLNDAHQTASPRQQTEFDDAYLALSQPFLQEPFFCTSGESGSSQWTFEPSQPLLGELLSPVVSTNCRQAEGMGLCWNDM